MDPFEQLQQQFVASFEAKATALEQALAENNVQALTVKLHQLAGSSGSYGFADMAQLCADIETMAQQATDLNPAITSHTQRLIQLLRQPG
ncbi:Hpt domain-containing protein [Marinicella meishanensis]|uniref:Hpt domain-containing protein n=1 Tax=Marinicella meishanensis TaxID=2873263 RepID=UPI001CBE2A0D|nr:Hpt domain-containing protein [Marinicella sp. NBU2979]